MIAERRSPPNRARLGILTILVHQKVSLIVIFFKKNMSYFDKKPVAVQPEV